MPEVWSPKDERQFEHVRKSAKKQGKSAADAREIAARVVNKQRRMEGRTPNKRSRGTGNPHDPLESRTRTELRNRAAQLGIRGRSKMRKRELVDAIRAVQ